MDDVAQQKKRKKGGKRQHGNYATERAWIDGRLAYRRLVYQMIKDIEQHCDTVICLVQNYLQVTAEQFDSLCSQEQVEIFMKQTESELKQKQQMLHRDI